MIAGVIPKFFAFTSSAAGAGIVMRAAIWTSVRFKGRCREVVPFPFLSALQTPPYLASPLPSCETSQTFPQRELVVSLFIPSFLQSRSQQIVWCACRVWGRWAQPGDVSIPALSSAHRVNLGKFPPISEPRSPAWIMTICSLHAFVSKLSSNACCGPGPGVGAGNIMVTKMDEVPSCRVYVVGEGQGIEFLNK